jgi:hypothetical protein
MGTWSGEWRKNEGPGPSAVSAEFNELPIREHTESARSSRVFEAHTRRIAGNASSIFAIVITVALVVGIAGVSTAVRVNLFETDCSLIQ